MLASKHWNAKNNGSKEEYASMLLEDALEDQIELMLRGHSWQDYMGGLTTFEDVLAHLDEAIQEGSNFYDFVEKMDIPESRKELYIEQFEDKWIEDHFIEKGIFPINGSIEEQDAFALGIIEKVDQYKVDHHNYKEEIKTAHINETKES